MRQRRIRDPRLQATRIAGVALTLLAVACSGVVAPAPGSGSATGTAPASYPHDDELRLNQMQVLGSHNSYHRRTPQAFRDGLEKVVPGLTSFWDYEQLALDQQFSGQGIRQIELDIWAGPRRRTLEQTRGAASGGPACR